MQFKGVPPVEWIDMMRKSLEVSRSDERTSEDPSMKLFDFWERRYGLKESRKEG
jgi:hypothetical protein